jgi:hypothetical protein
MNKISRKEISLQYLYLFILNKEIVIDIDYSTTQINIFLVLFSSRWAKYSSIVYRSFNLKWSSLLWCSE